VLVVVVQQDGRAPHGREADAGRAQHWMDERKR
jgi:hypothetical protein